MRRIFEYISVSLFALTAITLIGLQFKPWGWAILGLGVLSLLFCSKDFRRNLALLYGALALLGITPIGTSTAFPNALLMGIPLVLVVLVPYLVTKHVYKNNLVRFPMRAGRQWYRREIIYIFVAAVAAYLLLPPMLRSGESYLNWMIEPGFWKMTEAYIGLNFVGIWDELFFVSTVLGILRAHFTFKFANFLQAIVFTSFLFTLGFQGWSFIVVFIFALTQGYIFRRTDSLLYILTIHLTIDLVLHLALVYLHYPELMPIFIT